MKMQTLKPIFIISPHTSKLCNFATKSLAKRQNILLVQEIFSIENSIPKISKRLHNHFQIPLKP